MRESESDTKKEGERERKERKEERETGSERRKWSIDYWLGRNLRRIERGIGTTVNWIK